MFADMEKMQKFILAKDDFKKWQERLIDKYEVIFPSKEPLQGDILLIPINSPRGLSEDYVNALNSPKNYLFPRYEKFFDYEIKNRKTKIKETEINVGKPVLFLGVRSCDVSAVNYTDLFFLRDCVEPYYRLRRQKSILISLGCNNKGNSCFCHYMVSGPFLKEGFDMQLTDLGEDFLIEIDSPKGKSLIKESKGMFKESKNNYTTKQRKTIRQAESYFKDNYPTEKIFRKLDRRSLENFWEELGIRCINCAGCLYICPTCTCFNIADINLDTNPHELHTNRHELKGVRARCWDACTFSGFTRMAGGSNPYDSRASRVRRRFYSKIYNPKVLFNRYSCVGCGRCSFVCPVNLDMESVVASLGKENCYSPLLKEL